MIEKYQTAFNIGDKAMVVVGSREACEAVVELAEFYKAMLGSGKVKPASVNEDPFTEIFRRLNELEKNLAAVSMRVPIK